MTKGDTPLTNRRHLVISMAATFVLGALAGAGGTLAWTSRSRSFARFLEARKDASHAELLTRVMPSEGYRTTLSFGDSIVRLVSAGAISPDKFRRLYAARGGLPSWVEALFTAPSAERIEFSFERAPYLLNLFWPLGLATRAGFNATSQLNGEDLPNFASTGGWRLGKADNGAAYFNRVAALRLDAAREKAVFDIARNTFRPCCDNSTFFQDCNHGSALLGLLELAASQGASGDELYRLALVANIFWFPAQYAETVIYFAEIENKSWEKVAPRTVLGKRFSSASGWTRNVHAPLSKANLIPRAALGQQGGCGV